MKHFLSVLLCATYFLFAPCYGQERLLDSLHSDRGVNGTLDFRPEYRLYYPERDGRGRPLVEIRTEADASGNFRPVSRRQFTYDGANRTGIRTQDRDGNRWQDRQLERFSYDGELLAERIRQRERNGNLVNDRRWRYAYNQFGLDTLVLLQQWSGTEWVNLSRLRSAYTRNGDLQRQTLHFWRAGEWQGVRRRNYDYVDGGDGERLNRTLVQVWSLADGDWVNQSRQTVTLDGGNWVSSQYQDWNAGSQSWENTTRQGVWNDADGNPGGQIMEVWNGEWQNAGRARFTFRDGSFLSLIQQWNSGETDWQNFLRFRIDYDDTRRPLSRTGMQAWNTDVKEWENRAFTRRITNFWSSPTTSTRKLPLIPQLCRIPNPYPIGTPFNCPGMNAKAGTVQLELVDSWGRLVHRSVHRDGASLRIDASPGPGLYVVRLHDGERVFHLQKLVIP